MQNLWNAKNLQGRVCPTILRKTASTAVHTKCPDMATKVSKKMEHLTTTAATAYVALDKEENGKFVASNLRLLLLGQKSQLQESNPGVQTAHSSEKIRGITTNEASSATNPPCAESEEVAERAETAAGEEITVATNKTCTLVTDTPVAPDKTCTPVTSAPVDPDKTC